MTYVLLNVSSGKHPNTFSKISPQDAERALLHKWSLSSSGVKNSPPYVRAIIRGIKPVKQIKLHRFLLDAPDGVDVDHINGDTLDNTRENLRFVTCQQNQANSRKHVAGTSKFKGVAWSSTTGKWRAYIAVNRKQEHLGLYEDELDAARAYDRKAIEVWGEFAHLNLG